MSDNQEPQGDHYENTPGARAGDTSAKPEADESGTFTQQLEKNADRICAQLPSHIKRERFLAAAESAIRQNPDLLKCTPRSLFNAITKAAQDGLFPDGREGVITSYNTKVKVKNATGGVSEQWLPTAQWSPMTYGIRKRSRELDGILIDAQVVYQADTDGHGIIWEQGDEPKIIHRPAGLGSNRGAMIGTYAIFKREDGTILHREVMSKAEVEATRGQSKAKDSLMWTTFETEGWRKAVVRRGSKTVPVSDKLRELISRDDEAFDFSQDREALPAPTPKREPPPAPKTLEQTKPITLEMPDAKKGEPVPAAGQSVEVVRHEESRTISQDPSVGAAEADYQDFKAEAYKELSECLNEPAVEEIRERIKKDLKVEDFADWLAACAERASVLFNAGKKKK